MEAALVPERVKPRIREATPADARAVAALLGELGYPATTEQAAELLARFAADPGSCVLVAEVDSDQRVAVAGVVATHLVPRFDAERLSCRVVDLVVAADRRGAGVGRALMAAAERLARRRGATRVDLSSALERRDAHAFYRALGYESRSQTFFKRLGPGS